MARWWTSFSKRFPERVSLPDRRQRRREHVQFSQQNVLDVRRAAVLLSRDLFLSAASAGAGLQRDRPELGIAEFRAAVQQRGHPENPAADAEDHGDRKSTRLNSSH